jgi:O-succinylbenzoate synthase
MLAVGRVTPDPRLLAEHAASAERRQWWFDRVARCHAVLSTGG